MINLTDSRAKLCFASFLLDFLADSIPLMITLRLFAPAIVDNPLPPYLFIQDTAKSQTS